MEHLLHYTWQHKVFPLHPLCLTDGRTLDVINPGILNHNAGPDFLGACIKIDGTEWVGNVEIHTHTSDWFRHHHDVDPNYGNIILHVAQDVDQQLFYPNGAEVPQLQLQVPLYVVDNYDKLNHADAYPRCKFVLSTLPTILIHNWMTSLTLERFEMRTRQIAERRNGLDGNWEDTLFVTVARNFGFGINGNAFEKWAQSIPLGAVAKHRDDLFQIEAIFFGQAGLLEDVNADSSIGVIGSGNIVNDELNTGKPNYYYRLQKEYKYLRHKFGLTPMNRNEWKFLRLRPQNFPYIRIAQLAMMYYEQKMNMSRIINASAHFGDKDNNQAIECVEALFNTHVSDFWLTHYSFGSTESRPSKRSLSRASLDLLMINSVAPMLFAYGKYKMDQNLCDKAIEIWEHIKAEKNYIIRAFAKANVVCENAADSQALIQLHKAYCLRRDCLRCHFGHEYIRLTPSYLSEDVDK